MIAHYRCTRCGMNEHQARAIRCYRSPCPMGWVETTFRRWLRWHEGEIVLAVFAILIAISFFL